jgi:RNA polymerase sigma-70 factor (ECF subfamily)
MGDMTSANTPSMTDVWMDMFSAPAPATAQSSSEVTARRRQLDAFLQSVERRALCMLELGTRHREEALDLLQDCMLRFVRRYADRPAAEWPPLFFRVVSNALVDWQRRRSVRERIFSIWPWSRSDAQRADDGAAVAFDAPDLDGSRPEQLLERGSQMDALRRALAELPTRQRQTFLLREWEGLSVAEAALALGISEGSIKTHLSRAQAHLREALSEQA